MVWIRVRECNCIPPTVVEVRVSNSKVDQNSCNTLEIVGWTWSIPLSNARNYSEIRVRKISEIKVREVAKLGLGN